MKIKSDNGTAALRKGLSVLSCFSWGRTNLSLSEVAVMLGLPVPTASRLVKALKEEGFLEQDARTKMYSLGFKCYVLGMVAKNSGLLRHIALPYMQSLRAKFNETVNLYRREGDSRICYEQEESTQYLKRFAELGARLPIGAGASGRCFLAYMTREEIGRILRSMESFTDNTILDIETVLDKNKELREKGYTVSVSERESGVSSVASPILDASALPVACLAVSGPSQRFTQEMIKKLAPELKVSCHAISLKLGAAPEDISFLE